MKKKCIENYIKIPCEITGAPCAVIYPYDPENKSFYDIDRMVRWGIRKPKAVSSKPGQVAWRRLFAMQEFSWYTI